MGDVTHWSFDGTSKKDMKGEEIREIIVEFVEGVGVEVLYSKVSWVDRGYIGYVMFDKGYINFMSEERENKLLRRYMLDIVFYTEMKRMWWYGDILDRLGMEEYVMKSKERMPKLNKKRADG